MTFILDQSRKIAMIYIDFTSSSLPLLLLSSVSLFLTSQSNTLSCLSQSDLPFSNASRADHADVTLKSIRSPDAVSKSN